jgi:hypothetical protein
MNTCYRDQSGRLIKIEFEVCLENLFESSVNSHPDVVFCLSKYINNK